MLQLKNHTPFAADMVLFPDARGVDTLYMVVKATFTCGSPLSLAAEQPAPQKKDVFTGETGLSSLLRAGDFHTGKSATDILMTGSAFSPDAKSVHQMDVILKVAEREKTLRVIGDREWRQGRMSPPKPFVEMPLVYERAFGGTLLLHGALHQQEERNPVGLGFTGDLAPQEVDTWPLPNLEYPRQLIGRWGDRPTPAGFGPIAGHWQPRLAFAGTYDEHWQQTRAPFLPEDYSPRFMNAAPEDQIYPGFLQGGEPVFIRGMHPDGDLHFDLPRIHLTGRLSIGGRVEYTEFLLETLLLEPNQRQFSLVWRSAYSCDKHALKITQIDIALAR